VTSSLALARVPVARLLRTPRSWALVALWAALGVVSAILARRTGTTTGADHVMRGAFATFILPLVAYVIAGASLGGAGLRRAVRGVVALGAAPRRAALVTTLVAVAASAIAGAVLAVVVCAIAHGSGDAPLGADLVASAGVSALGGAAYGAFFSAGSALLRSGAMRGGFLVADWILGAGAGAGALLTPRGHVTALLGGALAADLPLRASSVVLLAQIALYTALAVLFTRRA
jgi:hypothetical protein